MNSFENVYNHIVDSDKLARDIKSDSVSYAEYRDAKRRPLIDAMNKIHAACPSATSVDIEPMIRCDLKGGGIQVVSWSVWVRDSDTRYAYGSGDSLALAVANAIAQWTAAHRKPTPREQVKAENARSLDAVYECVEPFDDATGPMIGLDGDAETRNSCRDVPQQRVNNGYTDDGTGLGLPVCR